MASYRITDGQSIFDIALQNYGTIESVVKVISENLTILENINNSNISNKIIEVEIINNALVNNLLLADKIINTSTPIINEGVPYNFGFNFGFQS